MGGRAEMTRPPTLPRDHSAMFTELLGTEGKSEVLRA